MLNVRQKISMEILASLIIGIAWPIATVWIALSFRDEARLLLGRVSTLKYKELEAKFEKTLEVTKKQVKQLSIEERKKWNEGTIKSVLTTHELFQRIAKISPRAAIIEYWTDLEVAISFAAKKAGINKESAIAATKKLIEDKNITPEILPLVEQLQNLRNQAAHLSDKSVSEEEALTYLDVVLKVGNEFRRYGVKNA